MRKTRRSGFTLIEVLLVLLILGMLATVAVVALTNTREGAKADAAKLMVTDLGRALDLYNMDIGHYPSEEEGGLNALKTKPNFDNEKLTTKWRGPYVEKDLLDPWNNPLKYERVDAAASADAGGKKFKIWSIGADGQDSTADDVKNWSDEQAQ